MYGRQHRAADADTPPVTARRGRIALVASAVAVGSALAFAGPAHASPQQAQATGRSDVCRAGLCGSGTLTWGAKNLGGGSMSVKDTGCDGKGVGIFIQVKHTDGSWSRSSTRYNDSGCHGGYAAWYGLHWNDSKRIAGFRVVGEKNGWNGATFYDGTYVDNPLT
jgi:hypothetical protein